MGRGRGCGRIGREKRRRKKRADKCSICVSLYELTEAWRRRRRRRSAKTRINKELTSAVVKNVVQRRESAFITIIVIIEKASP